MSDDTGKSTSDVLGSLFGKAVETTLISPALIGLLLAPLAAIGVTKPVQLDDPKNWRFAAIVLAFYLLFVAGGEALRRFIARWRVPVASGQKIGLLLARLDGDKRDDSLRETVREAIKRDLGKFVEIIIWPEKLRLGGGRDSDAEGAADAKAQEWLKSKRCDLLLWGRVKGDKTLSLRFTPASGAGTDPESYGLTADTLNLPVKFVSDLGLAIAPIVVTKEADAKTSSKDVLALMRTAAPALERMIKGINSGFDPDSRGSLLFSYAMVRDRIGDLAKTNDDYIAAVDAYRDALKEWTRERTPRDWAMAQNNLGNTLISLGRHGDDAARLEESVVAFREALKEYTRERDPFEWATTQNNLGNALKLLGERGSETALHEAVATYREALDASTRNDDPRVGAMIQMNLGDALRTLGVRESDTAHLKEAVTLYREALKGWTREFAPQLWAHIQTSLGAALRKLGECESNTAYLREATAAYREGLKERSRELEPRVWAETEHALGIALAMLGECANDTAHLEEALAAFGEALKETTREKDPVEWADIQINLAGALIMLDQRKIGSARLEETVAALRTALPIVELAGRIESVEVCRTNLAGAEALLEQQKPSRQ